MEAVELVELAGHLPLTREQLDDGHPGYRFLQISVNPGYPFSNQPVVLPGLAAEEVHKECHHRQGDQRDQRELEIYREHYRNDAGQRYEVHDYREGAGSEHFVDDIDIRGYTRDQASDRVAVEIGRLHPLHFVEDRHSHVGQRLLGHQHCEVMLPVQAQELANDSQSEGKGPQSKTVGGPGGYVVVDC